MALFGFGKRQAQAQSRKVPRHIAVIMDGNGRWAKKRGLVRHLGHAAGAETFRDIAYYCEEIGVKYFTVYAFSTENWKRPKEEVDAIMGLFRSYLKEAMETMRVKHVAVRVIGDLSVMTGELKALIEETNRIAATMTDCAVASLCINYGGRDEICYAVRKLAEQARLGKISPEDITEDMISRSLYTFDMPDPDLIIRPSGEIRISNFLLWQSAYSE